MMAICGLRSKPRSSRGGALQHLVALAENLFGRDGLFLAALGAGFMILLINVLCVSVFSVAVDKGTGMGLKRLGG